MLFKIFRTPGTGARSSKFSRRSERERDFDHKRTIWSGSVQYRIGIEIFPWKIKLNDESGKTCTMPILKHNQENHLDKMNRRNFKDVSSRSAMFNLSENQLIKKSRMLRTGARF